MVILNQKTKFIIIIFSIVLIGISIFKIHTINSIETLTQMPEESEKMVDEDIITKDSNVQIFWNNEDREEELTIENNYIINNTETNNDKTSSFKDITSAESEEDEQDIYDNSSSVDITGVLE